MQRKQVFRIIIGILAILALTLILGSSAGAAERKTLHKFELLGGGGFSPSGGLIFDAAGNLYGTTDYGGAYGHGTVFELTPKGDGSWVESVLHSFNDSDGDAPYAGLTIDAAGNLYGTTVGGGTFGYGTVFELTPNGDGSWTESVLHSFNDSDGNNPYLSGVIFDEAGNLYGTTLYGGSWSSPYCNSDGCGTVFKLTPNGDGSWTESVLHSFSDSDGEGPFAGVIFDAAGNLFGTTCGGSRAFGYGTVFELTPNGDGSWTERVLHSFNDSDGAIPYSGLIFDSAGNLYGTTVGGGASASCPNGCGTVFKLAPNGNGSWIEGVLHSFNVSDGAFPYAGLTFDAAGNLYGTAVGGGDQACKVYNSGCGTVFELTPTPAGGWGYRVRHRFRDHPGANPYAGLVLDQTGNLYGTTRGDGITTFGSVFEITP